MITGYNTDVRHRETVFHVQTEDKGASNPCIESLVYVGGQVLASKRASYAALLAEGKEEKDIVALMDHQHRTMIAAIRHGKFDEKLAALGSGRQTGHHSAILPPTPARGTAPSTPLPTMAPQATEPAPARAAMPAMPVIPAAAAVAPLSPPPSLSSQVIPAPVPPPTPQGVPPLPPLSAPAARPASPSAPERTLDQVILEYLTSEADQEQLVLLLEGEPELRLGQPASLTFRTSSSKSGLPVAGAQISVRMISTVGEPRVLASGRTGSDGMLPLDISIPPLGRGTAALIITAIGSIGRAELKHLL